MKLTFAIAIVLVIINQWDQNYNNGALTRVGFSLANELARAFGL